MPRVQLKMKFDNLFKTQMIPLIQYCVKTDWQVCQERLKENLPWTVADHVIHVSPGLTQHSVGHGLS